MIIKIVTEYEIHPNLSDLRYCSNACPQIRITGKMKCDNPSDTRVGCEAKCAACQKPDGFVRLTIINGNILRTRDCVHASHEELERRLEGK